MTIGSCSSICKTLIVVCATTLPAFTATVQSAGQFSLSGTVYVAQNEFLFGYYSVPTATTADQLAAILLPSQDVFGALRAGEIVGVKNLLTPANGGPFGPGPIVPGSPFLLSDFLTLPDGIDVDLTGLTVSSGVPVCTDQPVSVSGSFECRAQPGSPVVLSQSASGVTAILNLIGQAHYAASSVYTPVIGKLSANFTSGTDGTIDGLLGDFYRNGFIETSFSANISSVTSTPEPASFSLMVLCLIGLVLRGAWKRSHT